MQGVTQADELLRRAERFVRRMSGWIAAASLGSLALGLGLGLWLGEPESVLAPGVFGMLSGTVGAWLIALRTIVYPLIVASLLSAIMGTADRSGAGRIIGRAFAVHFTMAALVAVYAVASVTGALGIIEIDPGTLAAFRSTVSSGSAPAPVVAETPGPMGPLAWFVDLLTGSGVASLVILTIAGGFVLAKLPAGYRAPALAAVNLVLRVCSLLVRVVILYMPVVVVLIMWNVTASTGASVAGVFGTYVAAVVVLLIGLLVVLYPIAAILGGVNLGVFARAAAPAQAMAVGTRSSILCLPQLEESAEKIVGIPGRISRLVLPLSTSSFKVNALVTKPLNYFFLIYVTGVHPEPSVTITLLLAAVVLSVATPGLPSGGFVSMPIYLAAGIPIEAYLLLKGVDAIPDTAKTVCNVTADLTLCSIVSRWTLAREGRAASAEGRS